MRKRALFILTLMLLLGAVGARATRAYAFLSSDKKTLTFYYDDNRFPEAFGTSYLLNEEDSNPGWYDYRTSITNVVFHSSFADARPTSCYKWFYGMSNITGITGLNYLNTSEVKSMYCMFYKCSKLTDIDLSSFNTEKVENMEGMFAGCSSLTSLDLLNFQLAYTIECIDEVEMHCDNFLYGCTSLKSLTVPKTVYVYVGVTVEVFPDHEEWLETYENVDANRLPPDAFSGIGTPTAPCTLIYPSGFTPHETSTGSGWYMWKGGYFKDAVTQAYAVLDGSTLTFYYDKLSSSRPGTMYELNTGTDTPGWNSKATTVTKVEFDSNFANATPTTCHGWFGGMTDLTTITGIEYLNTSHVTDMSFMFQKCKSLKTLDISGFTLSASTTTTSMLRLCNALTSLSVPATANVLDANACLGVGTEEKPCKLLYPTDFTPEKGNTGYGWYDWKSGYFYDDKTPQSYAILRASTLTFYYDINRQKRSGTPYSLNTGTNTPGWSSNGSTITKIVFDASFGNAIPKSCYRWFYGMSNLTTITGLDYLNTSEVVNMEEMFAGCSSLTSLDLSNIQLAYTLEPGELVNKTVMHCDKLLYGCSSLQTLTVPKTVRVLIGSVLGRDRYSVVGPNSLTDEACEGVGTQATPCTLVYPSGFTPEKTSTGNGWYMWKGGYFKDAFKMGDANGDGSVSVSDVMMTVNYVLGSTPPEGFHLDNANVNGDKVITVADVMAIVDIVLSNTSNNAPAH